MKKWIYKENKDVYGCEISIEDEKGRILVIDGDYDVYGDATREELKLMAAAPELLEALESLLEFCDPRNKNEVKLVETTEKLILKVRGEKS